MPNVDVLITRNGNQLIETINLANDFRKVKTRDLKTKYKNVMKHPSSFLETHMADNDHAPLFVRNGDDIRFFHSANFRVVFTRDPDIEEELSSDDTPFLSGGNPISEQNAADTGVAGPQRYVAGPFRRNPQARDQQFYKFTIVTADFLVLDPDIIVEP